MNEEVCFIDLEGKKISCEEIASHIGLALELLKNNKCLQEEFEKSGKNNALDFFINKGYMTVSNMEYYRQVIFNKRLISEKQKEWLRYFIEYGYEFIDLSKEQECLEKGE